MIYDAAMLASGREKLRQDLPLWQELEGDADLARGITETLAGLCDLTALQAYSQRQREAALPRPFFSLRDQIGGPVDLQGETALAWLGPRAIKFDSDPVQSTLRFGAMGKMRRFPSSARAVLDFARRERFFMVPDAVSHCRTHYASDQAVVALLNDLVARHLVAVDRRGLHRWAQNLLGARNGGGS